MRNYSEVEFLEKVLSIPSVNGKQDTGKLAEFLAGYLRDCGLFVSLQKVDENNVNVITVLQGKTKEQVIWNGHLDTVPYGELSKWHTDPERPEVKNGRMYGRGSSDMKSGLAGMVYVLGQMKRQGHVPLQTIHFWGTADEEKGGRGAAKMIEEYGIPKASLLLIGEPTDCCLGIAQKGCVWLKAGVCGKTSHGAYPEEGENAVMYGFKLYETIREKLHRYSHPLLGKPTIQITGIQGGIAPNMTPDEAELCMDIRTVPGIGKEEILLWAKEEAEKYRKHTQGRVGIEFQIMNYRKAIETDEKNPWVQKMQHVIKSETGEGTKTGISFFTDASVFMKNRDDIPVILFGPGKEQLAHKPDEYVEIKTYLQYIRILRRLF